MKTAKEWLKYLRLFIRNFRKLYKKKIILEVHAAEHCNLKCSSCSHFSPLAEPGFCDTKVLEKCLKKLQYFQDDCEVFNILGGEPLLNPQICEIISLCRKYMDHTEICLVTNGILLLQPDKLPDGFWETCHETGIIINVTRYPIGLDYDKIKTLCLEKKVRLKLDVDRGDTGTGWLRWRLNEKGGGCRSYKYKIFKANLCQKRCLNIVGERIYPCNRVAHSRYLNKYFGTQFKIRKGDYIEIDKLKNRRQLIKLKMLAVPFCNYCPGEGTRVSWKPTRYEKEEWLEV